MGLLKKMASIFGIVLIAVAIANVEFGALMNLDPPQKLILSRLAEPGCSSDDIQKDLDSGDLNECVSSPGVWEAPDLLLLVEGCALFLTSFMRWPRKGRWAKRIRRTAVVSGVILCCVALADSFDFLPGASSEDLAALLPFPAPAVAVQIGIFMAGIFLVRGPKYRIDFSSKEVMDTQKRDRLLMDIDLAYKKGGDLGSLSKPASSKAYTKYQTVGDLWSQQNLSIFEDEFEGGMRDSFGATAGRTCHLCTGEGCSGCGGTGIAS